MNEIPCKDCLIIPICRNKTFRNLVMGCSLLKDYTNLGLKDYNPSYKSEIVSVIKPRLWDVSPSGVVYFKDEFINRLSSSEVKRHLIETRRHTLEGK